MLNLNVVILVDSGFEHFQLKQKHDTDNYITEKGYMYVKVSLREETMRYPGPLTKRTAV